MTLSEVKALPPDVVWGEIKAILEATPRDDLYIPPTSPLTLDLMNMLEATLDDQEYALYCGHLVALHGAKRVVSAPSHHRGRAFLLVKKKTAGASGP